MSTRYVWDKYNKISTEFIEVNEVESTTTKDLVLTSDGKTVQGRHDLYYIQFTEFPSIGDVLTLSRVIVNSSGFMTLHSPDRVFEYFIFSDDPQITFTTGITIYQAYKYSGGSFAVVKTGLEWFFSGFQLGSFYRCTVSTYTVNEKGSLIGQITGASQSSYPSDGVSGSYWYTYKGSDNIDPTRVTIPSSIKGGNRISISVTKSSTNTYGGTITYQYQICLNGSSTWTTLGSTTATSYSYTVPVGTTSIQARVLASDDTGFTSTDYVTSKKVIVHNNVAPSTPSSISVPSSVQAGKAFTISWGTSTDSDGNLSGYTLQRKLNSGSYTTIYTGSSRSYQDTIPKSGYTSVTYRVQAYDTDGATSNYRTSSTATVINNVAPVISGSNQNLGVFTYNPPYIAYIITDSNNDTVTVIVKLDSSTLESKTVTLGQTYTVPINWWDIGTGTHTVTITANDGQGGTATRTYTFTKNSVGQISFNRLHKKIDTGYQTTYIETDSDSIITNNGQVLSERLESIASRLSVSISTTPSEMVSRHRLHIKLTSEYTIDYLEMYSTNVKVGSSTLESILTQLESKVGISNSGTVPSNLNFERWRMKNSSGGYDIIYLEGVSEHIICPCGKTVEDRLVAIEAKL